MPSFACFSIGKLDWVEQLLTNALDALAGQSVQVDAYLELGGKLTFLFGHQKIPSGFLRPTWYRASLTNPLVRRVGGELRRQN